MSADKPFDPDEFMSGREWAQWSDCRELVEDAYEEGRASRAKVKAQSELGTLCFHIEQAIENGCCPYDIKSAYEAYVEATQSR